MPLDGLISKALLPFERDSAPKELLELNLIEADGTLAPVTGKLNQHCVDFLNPELKVLDSHFQRLAHMQLQPVALDGIRFCWKCYITKDIHTYDMTLSVVSHCCTVCTERFSCLSVGKQIELMDPVFVYFFAGFLSTRLKLLSLSCILATF